MSGGLNWSSLLAAGVRLGLAPDAVWQMTPGELLDILQAPAALSREELAALVAQYPDTPAKENMKENMKENINA